jgi:hypothetical protein
MDDACHGVINAFGLGPFADILVLAGKIAYMARRVAALADSLATFDYSKVFNSAGSMNFWDLIIQSLQCLLQCDNPKIKTLLDDQFSMMKGLQGKLEASMLSLPVLRSLHQNNASRGANNRNSNLLKLIRSLQALTSMSLADLCALPTPENPRPAQAPIMQPPNPAVLANPALEAARQAKITNARSFVGSVPYPP